MNSATDDASAGPAGLLRGSQRPRLHTCLPWSDSAGPEAVELAARGGLFADDWQSWFLGPSLAERDKDGKWLHFAVGLICPRQNGKDAILEVRQLAGLFLFGEELIVHSAHQFKTARESWLRLLNLIESHPDFDREVEQVPGSHGEEGIILKPTPAIITGSSGREIARSRQQRLRFVARSGSAARGFSGDLVIYNEAMTLDVESVAASLPTTMARMHRTDGGPQVWYTASAGKGAESAQLGRVRARGIQGGGNLCFAEWSIDPHDDGCEADCDQHDDPYTAESAAKANPGYNLPGRIDAEMVENARGEMDDLTFQREILGVGQYPVPDDGWAVIPRKWWEDTTDTRRISTARAVFGIDSSRFLPGDRNSTAIGAAGPLEDGLIGVEIVDYRYGTKWLIDRAVEINERHGPAIWIIDRRAAAGGFITDLEERGLDIRVPTSGQVAHACGGFYDATMPPATLRHAKDRELFSALAGLAKRRLGEGGYAWDRQSVAVDISPLYAVTLAHWGWLTFGNQANYDTALSVHFDTAEIIRLCKMGVYDATDLRRLWSEELLDDKALTELAAAGIPIPSGLT